MGIWNHTPGPWLRDGAIKGMPWTVHKPQNMDDLGPSLGMIATCEDFDGNVDTRIANAMLIAAAPELLEALEVAVQYWRWMVEDNPNQAGETEREELRRCETVLAKAKGE